MAGRDLVERNRDDCMSLPEMDALPNDRWREFVMALFDTGFKQTKAAALAGFKSDNGDALRVTAHRVLHDGRTQLAIDAVSKVYLNSLKPMAVALLQELMDPTKTPHATVTEKTNLVKLVADRTGLNVVQEHKHTVTTTAESPNQIANIRMLAEHFGLDPEKILGSRLAKIKVATAPTIDVEFEEVDVEDML